MIGPLRDRLIQFYRRERRFLYICRLHRPTDIALFLLPALWSAMLAAEGAPKWLPLLALLLAAFLFRCAVWVFNDWMDAAMLADTSESFIGNDLVSPREAQLLFSGLALVALLLLLPQQMPLLYYALAAPLLMLGLPLIKTRLLLTQPYLALCHAWLVPMAWVTQSPTPNKATWLLFTAVILWATAYTTLYAIPRRRHDQRAGIRSLALLFGRHSWLFVLIMQLGAVLALWLTARQQDLGIFFTLALLTVLLLLPYQHWLIFRHNHEGALRSYRSQIWSGIAVFCGIAFHFLCQFQVISS